MNAGGLVISLDFEGLWGALCLNDTSSFINMVSHIRVYPYKLLDIFNEYGIHATWATVGALLCESPEEMISYLDNDIIYSNWNLSVKNFVTSINKADEFMYFEPNIVREISNADNQEIGCHTFSHFYTREAGADLNLFDQEMRASALIMKKNEITLKSLVLPRNMIESNYIKVAHDNGIYVFRGRQNKAVSFTKGDRNKFIDYADSYIRIRRDLSYRVNDIKCNDDIYNVKASMFLRTYDARLSAFEKAKLSRIKKEMTYSAQEKKIFHLWWHPHNMATDIEKNCSMLRELFQHYRVLNEKYGYQSYTMSEIAQEREKTI